MTLHQLRLAVGDDDFHTIMTAWAAQHEGGNVTTDEFALAEQVSGQQLDELFQMWLFTAGRPTLADGARTLGAAAETAPAAAQSLIRRFDAKGVFH